MKKRVLPLLLCILMLTGCSWMDGSYVYVEPYQQQTVAVQTGVVSASNYSQLTKVLEDVVSRGAENCVINVADYTQTAVVTGMDSVCRYIREIYPIGAYAVEEITYEVGTNNGQPAVAVDISYRRSTMEIRQIRKKPDMDGACASIRTALNEHASRVVVLVENYTEMDFGQFVQNYARDNPQLIMEVPEISEGIYGSGTGRVIELSFTYQNSRDGLRQMQGQVRPVFEAAVLYVSGEGSEYQKFTQLSSFLTERFDYTLETSLTPSYSLLCHGVGDSRAFASVYAYMCRRAGLGCTVIHGTRDGNPWVWNMVQIDGNYYHADLLRDGQNSAFRVYADQEMIGYVWDYSAYPVCEKIYQSAAVVPSTEPEATLPEEPEAPTELPPEVT